MTRRLVIAVAIIVALGTTVAASAATLGVNPSRLTSFRVAGITGPAMTGLAVHDQDSDGRVDMVIVDFDGAVPTPLNKADWSLTNVPSGGSLVGVAGVGSQVFLTLTPGAGPVDTTVGGFTVAFADPTGSLTSFAATSPADAAGPVPIGLTTANGGATPGLMEAGDALEITFSEPLNVAGVPTSTPVTQSDISGNDFLSITGITNGSVNLGSTEYLHAIGKQASFMASSTEVAAPTVVRVTVAGTCSANPASSCDKLKAGQGAFVYSPAPTLTDAAGNPATGSFTTPATFRLF